MIVREDSAGRSSVADLLPWSFLAAAGVVATKNECLLGAWQVQGPDLASSTREELLSLSLGLQRVFRTLDRSIVVHVDLVRAPAVLAPGESFFPTAAAELFEARRRETLLENPGFENRHVLSITQSFRRPVRGWLQDLLSPERVDGDRRQWSGRVEAFEDLLARIEDSLRPFLRTRRLTSEGLLTHLHTCATGKRHPVRVPEPPVDLDGLLASGDLVGGERPQIGPQHLRCLSITGFPRTSHPAMLDAISDLGLPFRWSTRWLPLDHLQAAQTAGTLRTRWWNARMGFKGSFSVKEHERGEKERDGGRRANRDAVHNSEEAGRVEAAITAGAMGLGHLTETFVVFGSTEGELAEHTRGLRRALQELGIPVTIEAVNAMEAYMGSLPGDADRNVRQPLVSTRSLVDLLPMTTPYAGERQCPSPMFPKESPALFLGKTGETPFHGNLHVSDVGHTVVVGPTGKGKSVLLSFLMLSFLRYPDSQIFCFDKRRSALPFSLATGGVHHDVYPVEGEPTRLAPLQGIDDEAELEWAVSWILAILELVGYEVSSWTPRVVRQGLSDLAVFGASRRTLTQFVVMVQDEGIREALRPFTWAESRGMLDGAEDGLREARVQVFELAGLIEEGQRLVAPVLSYLFHRIERSLQGRPTLIVVDEAWNFLLQESFGEQIRRWLKEARKLNAAVVLASQSLVDFENPIGAGVWEQCATRVFLANESALEPASRSRYEALGLNARQVQMVRDLVAKREYYFVTSQGRRVIDLHLDAALLAVIGRTDPASLDRMQELHRTMGERWCASWLAECGRTEDAEALRELEGEATCEW